MEYHNGDDIWWHIFTNHMEKRHVRQLSCFFVRTVMRSLRDWRCKPWRSTRLHEYIISWYRELMQIQGVKTRNKLQFDNMDFGHLWTFFFKYTFCGLGLWVISQLKEPHMAGAASALLLQVGHVRIETAGPATGCRLPGHPVTRSGWKCWCYRFAARHEQGTYRKWFEGDEL